jgi:hypothetical protein
MGEKIERTFQIKKFLDALEWVIATDTFPFHISVHNLTLKTQFDVDWVKWQYKLFYIQMRALQSAKVYFLFEKHKIEKIWKTCEYEKAACL